MKDLEPVTTLMAKSIAELNSLIEPEEVPGVFKGSGVLHIETLKIAVEGTPDRVYKEVVIFCGENTISLGLFKKSDSKRLARMFDSVSELLREEI